MSHKKKPTPARRSVHEAGYFHGKNRNLVDQLRLKLERDAETEAIRSATGVEDEELLATLIHLGVTRDSIPVLHLLPLVEVAWADGEIQDDERALLVQAARNAGVEAGSAAGDAFDAMLTEAPSEALFDAGLTYVKALMLAMPEEQAGKARRNLSDFAYEIARANGGIFGIIGKVEPSEKDVLAKIADRLMATRGQATQKLIGEL